MRSSQSIFQKKLQLHLEIYFCNLAFHSSAILKIIDFSYVFLNILQSIPYLNGAQHRATIFLLDLLYTENYIWKWANKRPLTHPSKIEYFAEFFYVFVKSTLQQKYFTDKKMYNRSYCKNIVNRDYKSITLDKWQMAPNVRQKFSNGLFTHGINFTSSI